MRNERARGQGFAPSLFCALLIALAGCKSGCRRHSAKALPGAISQSTLSVAEFEADVAAAPDGRLSVAWIAARSAHRPAAIGYRFMREGDPGAVKLIASPDDFGAADPSVAFDRRAAQFALAWLAPRLDKRGAPTGETRVYVAREAGGAFAGPREVSERRPGTTYDKPWLAVAGGRTLVAYAVKGPAGGGIEVATSDDGARWTRTALVDDPEFVGGLPFVCASRVASRVWVTYLDAHGVVLRWSDDRGASWPVSQRSLVSAGVPGIVGFDSPSCAGEGDDVAVAYPTTTLARDAESPPAVATIVYSTDGGRTIGRQEVFRDPAGHDLLRPTVARSPSGQVRCGATTSAGRYVVTGFDRPLREGLPVFRARSERGWGGDYAGVTVTDDGTWLASIADASAGLPHIVLVRARIE